MSLLGAVLRALNPITHALTTPHYYVARVDEKLWRGSKQTLAELLDLKSRVGIKSCVSLNSEDKDGDIQFLFQSLEAREIRYEHLPIEDNGAPTMEQIDFFVSWVEDEQNQPALTHCRAGKGRTGVMVACWRVHTGWPVERALEEASVYGMVLSEQFDCVREWTRMVA